MTSLQAEREALVRDARGQRIRSPNVAVDAPRQGHTVVLSINQGLQDIAEHFGTQHFWRLRIGIGHPGDKDLVADYVLSQPAPEERELIEQALAKCLEVSPLLLEGDMRAAMLKLHTRE